MRATPPAPTAGAGPEGCRPQLCNHSNDDGVQHSNKHRRHPPPVKRVTPRGCRTGLSPATALGGRHFLHMSLCSSCPSLSPSAGSSCPWPSPTRRSLCTKASYATEDILTYVSLPMGDSRNPKGTICLLMTGDWLWSVVACLDGWHACLDACLEAWHACLDLSWHPCLDLSSHPFHPIMPCVACMSTAIMACV